MDDLERDGDLYQAGWDAGKAAQARECDKCPVRREAERMVNLFAAATTPLTDADAEVAAYLVPIATALDAKFPRQGASRAQDDAAEASSGS